MKEQPSLACHSRTTSLGPPAKAEDRINSRPGHSQHLPLADQSGESLLCTCCKQQPWPAFRDRKFVPDSNCRHSPGGQAISTCDMFCTCEDGDRFS